MKRSILLAVLGMAATTAARGGGGQIYFKNYYSSAQTTGITYGNGPDVGLGVGPEISATLLWGASTDTLISQLSPVVGSTTPFGCGVASGPDTIVPATGAGWFLGPTVSINGGVPGNYAFAIEAIGTLSGKTYIGFSPVVVGPTSTSSNPGEVPTIPIALEEANFTVSTIPEPSIALLGVGAAALILNRRRK